MHDPSIAVCSNMTNKAATSLLLIFLFSAYLNCFKRKLNKNTQTWHVTTKHVIHKNMICRKQAGGQATPGRANKPLTGNINTLLISMLLLSV